MRLSKSVALLVLFAILCYGGGRLYYRLTAGFTVSNITNSQLTYDTRWAIRPLTIPEQEEVNRALSQEYYYLGKGCQSYVFVSQDGANVIKFPKYQRFRPQAWIDLFTWIPAVADYQANKAVERRHFLDKMFCGWSLGFDRLSKETGVLYIHLNKTPEWSPQIVLHDKLGFTHTIDLGQMEFLLQKRAAMLDSTIANLMSEGNVAEAELILDRLLAMVLSEYFRGLADNDHALVQNTGIVDGQPIHIDVGQFVRHKAVQEPKAYAKELFNKTYRMHEWLAKEYPILANHVKSRVVAVIGPEYYYLPPYVYRPNFDKLPDDEMAAISP